MTLHMRPEIISGTFVEIETQFGTTVVPMDVAGTTDKDELLQYTDCSTEEDIEDVSVVEGFGVRLSAAGYMDCTDWTVVDSEEEAQEKIIEWFGITWCEECRAWHDEDTCPDCEETER